MALRSSALMGAADILELAQLFGPMGLLVGYVVWDKQRVSAKWLDHEKERLAADKQRIETDKALALAMQALTIAIQSK